MINLTGTLPDGHTPDLTITRQEPPSSVLSSTLTLAFREIRCHPDSHSQSDLEQISQITRTLLSQSPPL